MAEAVTASGIKGTQNSAFRQHEHCRLDCVLDAIGGSLYFAFAMKLNMEPQWPPVPRRSTLRARNKLSPGA